MLRDNLPAQRLKRELAYLRHRLRPLSLSPSPWLDPETVSFLEERLPGVTSYIEYGSGGTTLMAAQLSVIGTSVESDRRYAEAVKAALGQVSSMRVVHSEIGRVGPWGIPVSRSPSERNLRRWRRYIEAPYVRGGVRPDLVLVDGRFRVACAVRSLLAISGGDGLVLVDDFTDRPAYWVLESLARVEAFYGRAVALSVDEKKTYLLPDALQFFSRDWT